MTAYAVLPVQQGRVAAEPLGPERMYFYQVAAKLFFGPEAESVHREQLDTVPFI